MFETLEPMPADAILKLIGEHKNDPREEKIDLGVGVYRDADGNTPILNSVKKAEHWLVGTQTSKAYLGSRGDAVFCDDIVKLVFGDAGVNDDRIATVQSPGGSGALRVGAELMLRANPDVTMWVSDPTWSNHIPLMGNAGVKLQPYPYYDLDQNCIRFDEMLETLGNAKRGEVVLLHGCCHNPTGMDLNREQWDQVADLVHERGLIPFIDIAYQGFADGLEEDAYGVRLMYGRVPEMIVTQSCSKNFGIYRDRVGALSFVAADADAARVVDSQALSLVRTIYSLPPDHGAAVVSHILNDDELREEWRRELAGMRERLGEMRTLLVDELKRVAPAHDFSHIERTTGMFCYLGVTPEQVAALKKDRGIYLVDSSRINVCGITAGNVRYLAESIASILQEPEQRAPACDSA
ncbi:MAG: aspartate/tyrosine/aromatic aminotransferase [Gammaproteobacteria bacterium]|nr:aspartate/tyrosine/aromatic aminotransferase [Gammaproteobacteria bacterium]